MATISAIVLLVYSFSLASGYELLDDNDEYDGEILTLVSEYYMKAERLDLIKDNKLPMELWYSEEHNRSRVDVFDGMVRRYFYWGEDGATGDTGEVYMVYPSTTSHERNKIVCTKKEMGYEEPGDAFLADTTNYTYTEKTQHEGQEVDMWELKEEEEDNTRRHNVLYTYRTKRGDDVPVQLVKKKFNTKKGTIDTHVIINYYNYDPIFCETELDAENDEPCQDLPDDFHGQLQALHPAFDEDLGVAFNSFKKHHSKEYRSQSEHEMRKEIFRQNWQLVVDQNRQNLGYTLALNHLSDLSPQERRRLRGTRRFPGPAGTPFPYSDEEVRRILARAPREFDLRLEGVVSPIKDQIDCGSCWTFAVTATVEGALAKEYGEILDLSEQSILDCNWEGDNEGCDGGFPEVALQYVVDNGLPLEENYGGYLAQDGFCHVENDTDVFWISGFTHLGGKHKHMKVALYRHGPVVIYMESNDAFDFYSHGVYWDPTCKGRSNHAVTIVGYGRDNGYWLVKNSYGQRWGEDGYMLVDYESACIDLNHAYYVVV